MENKIYYISGPITHPDPKVMEENKLAFHCAEELLKQQGFKNIVNHIVNSTLWINLF